MEDYEVRRKAQNREAQRRHREKTKSIEDGKKVKDHPVERLVSSPVFGLPPAKEKPWNSSLVETSLRTPSIEDPGIAFFDNYIDSSFWSWSALNGTENRTDGHEQKGDNNNDSGVSSSTQPSVTRSASGPEIATPPSTAKSSCALLGAPHAGCQPKSLDQVQNSAMAITKASPDASKSPPSKRPTSGSENYTTQSSDASTPSTSDSMILSSLATGQLSLLARQSIARLEQIHHDCVELQLLPAGDDIQQELRNLECYFRQPSSPLTMRR